MTWPTCVLLVPLAVCWPWISHAVGCKQGSWPAVSAAESGKQQLVKQEDKENWDGVKEALQNGVLSNSEVKHSARGIQDVGFTTKKC